MFSIVEYTGSENLSRPLHAHGTIKRSIRTYDEALDEVKRELANNQWKVRGYNEECDYYWARTQSPTPIRRILRIEPG